MRLCHRREFCRKQGLRRLRRSYRRGVHEKRRPGGGPRCGGDGCEKRLRVHGCSGHGGLRLLPKLANSSRKSEFRECGNRSRGGLRLPRCGVSRPLPGRRDAGHETPEIRLKSTGNQPVSKNSLPNPQLVQLISSISFPYPCAGARARTRKLIYAKYRYQKSPVIPPKMKPINKLMS